MTKRIYLYADETGNLDYATTEAIYGPHPSVLADELEVTKHLLKTWQSLHANQAA